MPGVGTHTMIIQRLALSAPRGQDAGIVLARARSAGGLAEPAGEVIVQVPLTVADPGDVAVGA